MVLGQKVKDKAEGFIFDKLGAALRPSEPDKVPCYVLMLGFKLPPSVLDVYWSNKSGFAEVSAPLTADMVTSYSTPEESSERMAGHPDTVKHSDLSFDIIAYEAVRWAACYCIQYKRHEHLDVVATLIEVCL